MSQLSGHVGIDLNGKVTFAARLHITATQQTRRKVLWEVAEQSNLSLPRITVELDKLDNLYVIAEGRDGIKLQTKKTHPKDYASRPVTIRFTSSSSVERKIVALNLYIDGVLQSSVEGRCDLTCDPKLTYQSIGSSISGGDPATFRTYGLMCIDRILDPLETARLETWMREKAPN